MLWETRIQSHLESLRAESRYRSLEKERGWISFSHNDYLSLSSHPQLLETARQVITDLPGGSRGSRLLGGNVEIFEKLESEIARFFGSPQALFFGSGFLANQAVVTALAPFSDHIWSDEKCHASLIDAARLSGRPKRIVPHQRWEVFSADKPLLLAESLYSMDGDAIDSVALREAWDLSEGFLILDEAHAAGIFDETGRGISHSWRDWSRMAVTVTFGKAFGTAGAAVLCSQSVKELLINSARSFLYTTAPSPWTAALVICSLQVMEQEGPSRRAELWERAREFRRSLVDSGVPLATPSNQWDNESPIIPIPISGNDRALRFAEVMRKFGWGLRAIRHPTVPRGSERVRISLNLDRSRSDIGEFANKVVEQWKAFS